VAPDFAAARARAYTAVGHIAIEGAHHRTDIGPTVEPRERLHA
jgi:hypothetical protein